MTRTNADELDRIVQTSRLTYYRRLACVPERNWLPLITTCLTVAIVLIAGVCVQHIVRTATSRLGSQAKRAVQPAHDKKRKVGHTVNLKRERASRRANRRGR